MSPLPKDPEKAQIILNSAFKVFSEKGIEKGTIAEIAKASGLGKGTVYEYYTSKEDIYYAMECALVDSWQVLLDNVLSQKLSCSKKLETLLHEAINETIHAGDAILVIYEIWSKTIRNMNNTKLETPMTKMYESFHGQLVALLEEGIKKREFREMHVTGVATMIIAFLDGIAIQLMMLKSHFEDKDLVNQSIKGLLNGLLINKSL